MENLTLRKKVARSAARNLRLAKATFKRARMRWEVAEAPRIEAYRTLVRAARSWHACKEWLTQ